MRFSAKRRLLSLPNSRRAAPRRADRPGSPRRKQSNRDYPVLCVAFLEKTAFEVSRIDAAFPSGIMR